MLIAQMSPVPGGSLVAVLLLVIVVSGLVFVIVRTITRAGSSPDEGRISDLEQRVDELERRHEEN